MVGQIKRQREGEGVKVTNRSREIETLMKIVRRDKRGKARHVYKHK